MIFLATEKAFAEWQLYDDFSSGIIAPNLWDIDDSSAEISIDNGRLKFVHLSGFPGDSSYLILKNNPEEIKGIRATVEVASCTGDVRARLVSLIGKLSDDSAYHQLSVQPSSETIWGDLWMFPGWYGLFYSHFEKPTVIIGNTFTVTIYFSSSRNELVYKVDGLGEASFVPTGGFSPPDEHFRGIGTRSSNGDGPCVVYFDDVWVFRGDFGSLCDISGDGKIGLEEAIRALQVISNIRQE